jgi:serine/threonine-protein kinase HipA
MPSAEKTIFAYASWLGDPPSLIGMLHVSVSKGHETISFEYASEWLSSFGGSFFLDPDLRSVSGRQCAPKSKSLFGLFSDSCPNRWGRGS